MERHCRRSIVQYFLFALLTLQAITFAQHIKYNRSASADRILNWLAFTVGLSLAHHRTTLFYLPSLVAWIWWYDPALIRQPRRLLRLVLLTLAPLMLYLFIYLRGVNHPPTPTSKSPISRAFGS